MLPAKQIQLLSSMILLLASAVPAQYKFEKAVRLTRENGLPVTNNRFMAKGSDGFIWIGTEEGLCRFDGSQAKMYTEGKDLLHSLMDNVVSALLPLNDKIWIGTRQGLSVLNTYNNTFKHYQFSSKGKTDSLKRRFDQNISFLYRDRSGKIWVGTSDRGVAMYDEKKDDFIFYTLSPSKFPPLIPSLGPNNSILNITASNTNDSIIWAGTASGLQQINKYTGKVELFTFPDASKDFQVALNAFRRLYHHDDGLLYVGSWAASVNVFDPVAKTFKPLEVKNETGGKIIKSVIGSLDRKSDHEIWVSTLIGLAVYDTKLKDVTWYKLNDPDNSDLYSIGFVDEAQRVWYSDVNGLSYFDPVLQQFASYSFKKYSKPDWAFAFYIIPDNTGNRITVCPRVADGIIVFDKQKKEWTKTNFSNNETFLDERKVVKGFVEISPGEYIISSDKGIYQFSYNKKTIKKIEAGFPFGATRRGDLIAGKDGNLWFSDNTWGLTKWNPTTNHFVNYKEQTVSYDSVGPLTRLINLYEDSRGNVWFQRQGGMGVYIKAEDRMVNFYYLKNEANCFATVNGFAEDRNGRVWASSMDGWIGYANANDPAKGIIQKINIKEKGINGDIQRLATDKNGDVWGHTLRELVKIRTDNQSFRTYDFKYGAKEADFYHFSFLPSGEMIFGGRNEIVIANPDELKRNAEIPIPYITEIHVLNQPYRELAKDEPLNLNQKQNFFSIGFSSIAYTMPADVKFRFRLKNFDDWSEPTTRRFANYTNVPGGDYVFELQAANNEGLWNKTIYTLPIHVATPYWLTWWFRIAMLVLLAVIVYAVYKYRVNQFRKKEKLKSDYEKKIANVEMSSLLAQMNPHFLFNSLNSIDSYIIKNETHKASEYLNNFARLMRLILQNSRSNYITLKDELEALDLYLQMESLRFKNKFEYEIKTDEEINTNTIVIPPMLIQPFVENAIWHGLMHKQNGEPGKVEIKISSVDNKLKCEVVDNGIGRNKAEEIKMQKNGSHKRSMGMQITSDRIEMINKLYGTDTKVKITDLADVNGDAAGTKVELEIPI
jgi:sensor histidine kinase YesM/ligand-binding sensor domain-containing protein